MTTRSRNRLNNLQESGPRSYSVQTASGQYRHNHRHIISLPTQSNHRQNPLITNTDVLPDECIELPSKKPASTETATTGTKTRSGRISKPPDRLNST